MSESAAPSLKKLSFGLDDEVEDLLLWRDVKKSGIVFGSITVAYLLLEWSGMSLLTILADALLLAVLVAFLWANIGSVLGRPGPPVPEILQKGVTDADLKAATEAVKGPLNKALAFLGRLAAGKEAKLAIWVMVGCFVLSKIGGLFSLLGFLYTVVLLAFTVPKAYEFKKDEADMLLSKAQSKFKEGYAQFNEQVMKKIPRGSNARKLD